MRIEKIVYRNRVILMFLVVALSGAPRSVAGQFHTTANELVTAMTNSGASEDARAGTVRAWVGPTARTLARFSTTQAARDQFALSPTVIRLMPQVRNRRGVPYMVAGGILFVAGAITGDDAGTVLMIGGAGVGAYGAFVYFGG